MLEGLVWMMACVMRGRGVYMRCGLGSRGVYRI